MELNALSRRRRQLERQQDRRTALIAWTIAQAHGAKDMTIEDFMPKTEEEMRETKMLRLLAWFEAKAAASQAEQESH